jgi:hypothetical protein
MTMGERELTPLVSLDIASVAGEGALFYGLAQGLLVDGLVQVKNGS